MDYVMIADPAELIGDIPEASIISRTIHEMGDSKTVLFGFAPGQALSEHTAARPAILHFLSGQAQVTLGEDSHQVDRQAWIYMPANLPHSVYAETRVVMLLQLLPN